MAGTKTSARLPTQQLAILALIRFAEPLALTSVYPYIPEMIRSFQVPDKSIAKYVGLLSLTFSISQAFTGIAWGRASDKIGRKPTILLAKLCTMISSILFGFSSNLPMAFITRSMQGLSAGTVGMLRTTVAELVPQKELQPTAFSIVPVVWMIGSIFGPIIGGALVFPTQRFPKVFGNIKLLEIYPFALPNLLIGLVFLVAISTGFLFLRETLKERRNKKDYGLIIGSAVCKSCTRRRRPTIPHHDRNDPTQPLLVDREAAGTQSTEDSLHKSAAPERPCGWAEVFTYQSNLNLLVYTLLAMHSVAFDQLLPVFLDLKPIQTIDDPEVRLPIKFNGGLALDTQWIGTLFSIYGVFGMIIQLGIFPPVVRKYSSLACFKVAAVIYPIIYMLIPYVSLFRTDAQRRGAILTLMLVKCFCTIFAYPCSTILLTNSAANLKVLGTLNGVMTSIGAVGRAIGPAMGGFMFSIGANLGYIILPWWTLAIIAVIGAVPAWWLIEADGFGDDTDSEATLEDQRTNDEADRQQNPHASNQAQGRITQ